MADPFAGNSRGYLQSVVKRAKAMGLRCDVGCECEFYLFQTDEHGNPTRIPMDHGGYFDIAPLDKAENIRREICFAMEDMGLRPQHSHHESGFGQNEVDFMYSTALKSADNLNTFKSTVKAIADRKRPVCQLYAQAHAGPGRQRHACECFHPPGWQKPVPGRHCPRQRGRTFYCRYPCPRKGS